MGWESGTDQWSDDLQQLAEPEEYFFCLNQFLYLVTKPQS